MMWKWCSERNHDKQRWLSLLMNIYNFEGRGLTPLIFLSTEGKGEGGQRLLEKAYYFWQDAFVDDP